MDKSQKEGDLNTKNDSLPGEKICFFIKRRSILRYLAPYHGFAVEEPYMGTLLRMSQYYAKLDTDTDFCNHSSLRAGFGATRKNARLLSYILAVSILNDHWKIKLLEGLLARYLMWHLPPSELLKLCFVVISQCNTTDFVNSVYLATGTSVR